MLKKILVANRGEIAIRAFRAASELRISTVGIYAYEDRYSLHRQKSDESYQIGEPGHPLRSYLDVDSIIEIALKSQADGIYPGYGFLSENPLLSEACVKAGIKFIGPSTGALELAGNKMNAVAAARRAGIPTLKSLGPVTALDDLSEIISTFHFPLFVKASAGGGGRGLRKVDSPDQLSNAITSASTEAQLAFGDPTIFIEEAVIAPRHIEVQILADEYGEVVHLFERDCSIQRRHQKVVEIAPAPNLSPDIREKICNDAVKFAASIGYSNAGTVEFLLDSKNRHVFIEMNPRIQVEHTVTEEVTGVDIVQAQIKIASGQSLTDLEIRQEGITTRGSALQCRITTEDPSDNFRPDTGRISAYRAPGGAGIRLDESTYSGAQVLPYFDSMLVKLTTRGHDYREAIQRADRALREFRIRGVATNIGFLQELLKEEDFRHGQINTSYIESHPELLKAKSVADRGTKLLTYISDISVNRPNGSAPTNSIPNSKLPKIDLALTPSKGSKNLLSEVGPAEFARLLREQKAVAITDTTLRDAHQSLLATRLRTKDMVAVAPYIQRLLPGLLSIEAWGGATYDVALRFLKEDPWSRLEQLREEIPNIAIQMLLRGQSTVAYTPQPEPVAKSFVKAAVKSGVDIFRVFDALNNVQIMRPEIDAVLENNAVAEGTLCYTSDMTNPKEALYTVDYYLRIAEQLVSMGCHILCIKDMAGLAKAPAAAKLVKALRSNFDLPVHFHTHDTAGGQLATYLAAIEAGVDAVDGATASLGGTTSQPPLSAIIAALENTPYDSGIDLSSALSLEPYFDAVRKLYRPFESGLSAPTGRVYHHEIPGGQLSNLRQQAIALGLGDHFERIEDMYAAVNKILGNIVKVTPSSKVVGDLALGLVAADADPTDFEENPSSYDIPDSVIGFLQGELGIPASGWPEPFRTKALTNRTSKYLGPKVLDQESLDALEAPNPRATLSRLLFPGPAKEYEESLDKYGSLSVLDTKTFFYGLEIGEETSVKLDQGVDLYLALDAIGGADERGIRDVYCRLNGQLRVIPIRDNSIKSTAPKNERADSSNPGHISAPFSGVVTIAVALNDTLNAGQTIATIEAMKMEAAITTSVSGRVKRIVASGPTKIEAGDLLIEVEIS
ncbi:pyruvate carboxylase [Acidithrix sp. C25]|uniref:pyruvate carboxylase n=1 Tax=Acidithrix sp. C25 TaxID=1671482 RepID=UPI00191BB68A|nr:pyruvate carboxylase [Acidithrix sp. C25]CAG4927655.1 unnamed protein product [Acidithrix sp. C25]